MNNKSNSDDQMCILDKVDLSIENSISQVEVPEIKMEQLIKYNQTEGYLARINDCIYTINKSLANFNFNKRFYSSITTLKIFLDPENLNNKPIFQIISKYYDVAEKQASDYMKTPSNRNIFKEESSISMYHIIHNQIIPQNNMVSCMSRQNCGSNKMYTIGPNIGLF